MFTRRKHSDNQNVVELIKILGVISMLVGLGYLGYKHRKQLKSYYKKALAKMEELRDEAEEYKLFCSEGIAKASLKGRQ